LTLPIVLLFAAFVSADDPSMPLKRVLIVYGLAQLAAFGIDSLIFMRRIPPPIEPNTTPTGPNWSSGRLLVASSWWRSLGFHVFDWMDGSLRWSGDRPSHYLRFTLSFRDVEDLLAARGLDVSYESVRRWVLKFGPMFARGLRHRRHRPTARWHLDEMAVIIGGQQFWLWRAVDDKGEVLDLLAQWRRDKHAAEKLRRKLFKKQGFAPDVLVRDKLPSYGAAKAQMGLSARTELIEAYDQTIPLYLQTSQGLQETFSTRWRWSMSSGSVRHPTFQDLQDLDHRWPRQALINLKPRLAARQILHVEGGYRAAGRFNGHDSGARPDFWCDNYRVPTVRGKRLVSARRRRQIVEIDAKHIA
jgi:transposase-like protein